MKVTGVGIQFAIQQQNKKIKMLDKKFKNGIKRFENDPKEDLVAISKEIEQNELLVAQLQSILTNYNLRNMLDFDGERITLAEAIKITGVLDRTEVRWRGTVEDRDRYDRGEQRSNDTQYREYSMTFDDRAAQQEKAQLKAARMRKTIQLANALPVELEVSRDMEQLISVC